MQGIVFQIQRFSLYDGPGIRTVVFLKGCPLRCIWCHNPEGICTEPQIMYNPAQCIGCGTCAGVCPQGCHLMRSGGHLFARDQCISCGKCAEACFSRALSVVGKRMSADEVMEEVLRDLPFYRESGGGLTLSGGEPFMQPGFALALLKSAKEHGIFTCVETSGETSEQVKPVHMWTTSTMITRRPVKSGTESCAAFRRHIFSVILRFWMSWTLK